MDILKLRYLIREAIENIANISSKFSVGDVVTTKDRDKATVTMAEHPFYTVELESTGTTKSFSFTELAPYEEKIIAKTSEGISLKEGVNASPGLLFHQTHKISLSECVFRIGSNAYVDFFTEARKLFNEGVLNISEGDKYWINNTDIGKYGDFDGKPVPLDIPFVNEGSSGADTAWEDDKGNKVTLQDILDMTKNIPQKDYPTEKLAKIVLNWDDNPEEVERIEQVEVSKQYPILIMVDEAGEIQWILDGNHRAQKALRSKSKTIPAKLIKPSNLDAKAKKVLLGVVNELNEREDALGIYDDNKGNSASINRARVGFIADIDGENDYQIGPAATMKELIKMLADEGFTQKIFEAQFKGKDVSLNKPKRGGSKAYYVYVKNGDKVKKVSFGSGGLRAKINNPKARKAFAARHNCKNKKDRTTAGYWSCNLPRYAKALGLGANKNTFW